MTDTPVLRPHATTRFTFAASKVAPASAMFWIIKVLTTGIGETSSDWLVIHLDPLPVVVVTFVVLLVCLTVQLAGRTYRAWSYWLLVAVIAVFGTMVADVAHVVGSVSYEASTLAFGGALAVLFVLWWRVERTISIHDVTTTRRELFYWTAVGLTFALGTAAGDLTARSVGLGYLLSAVLFGAVIAVPAVAFRAGLADAVTAFWAAYIITRPLGASIADYLAVATTRGGLGAGTGVISLIGASLLIVLVAIESRRRRPGRVGAN